MNFFLLLIQKSASSPLLRQNDVLMTSESRKIGFCGVFAEKGQILNFCHQEYAILMGCLANYERI